MRFKPPAVVKIHKLGNVSYGTRNPLIGSTNEQMRDSLSHSSRMFDQKPVVY